jgi:hypothetical protein
MSAATIPSSHYEMARRKILSNLIWRLEHLAPGDGDIVAARRAVFSVYDRERETLRSSDLKS